MLNAYAVFAQIVKARRAIAMAHPPASSGDPAGVIIEEVTAEENLFNRQCSFMCSYRILQPLDKLLTDSGLWTPLSLNTWAYWGASVAAISDQRGYANMAHLSTADAIWDPCGAIAMIPFDAATIPKAQTAPTTKELLKNEKPKAENSWISYDSHVLVMRNRAVVVHSVLQAAGGGRRGV